MCGVCVRYMYNVCGMCVRCMYSVCDVCMCVRYVYVCVFVRSRGIWGGLMPGLENTR